MICKDRKLGSKPKKNIKPKKGIKDRPKFINEDDMAEIGKIKVGTLIDFNTPALEVTDTIN